MTSERLSSSEPAQEPQDLYWNGEGQAEQERRRYFRIEEQVILTFREVPFEEIPAVTELRELPELPCNPFALTSSLELLSQEARSLLRRIEREDPDIADCLRVIERKVDIIGRTLMSRESDLTECPPKEVNLSASGLSFATDQTFDSGSVLEIKMVLLPNLWQSHLLPQEHCASRAALPDRGGLHRPERAGPRTADPPCGAAPVAVVAQPEARAGIIPR